MSKDWMTPKDYYEHIVKPTVQEYRENKSDHRKENAVFQLSSFSERYFKYHRERKDTARIFGATTAGQFGEKVAKMRPEYGLLCDAANGVKHHFPDGKTRAGAIETTSTGVWDTTEYEVCGLWVTIDQAIDVVYDFWRKLLAAESD